MVRGRDFGSRINKMIIVFKDIQVGEEKYRII